MSRRRRPSSRNLELALALVSWGALPAGLTLRREESAMRSLLFAAVTAVAIATAAKYFRIGRELAIRIEECARASHVPPSIISIISEQVLISTGSFPCERRTALKRVRYRVSRRGR